MQQPENVVEYKVSHLLGALAILVLLRQVKPLLDHLHIPVAEVMPDEIIKGLHRAVEPVLLHQRNYATY